MSHPTQTTTDLWNCLKPGSPIRLFTIRELELSFFMEETEALVESHLRSNIQKATVHTSHQSAWTTFGACRLKGWLTHSQIHVT